MSRCTSLRGSSRVICFTAANKGYIASLFRSQAFSSSKLSSKPNDEALRDSHNVVAEENCTENGNESSGSVIHPDHLPISPLVDSKVKEARERWRTPKAAPSQNPTPFQQLLAKNPYGNSPSPFADWAGFRLIFFSSCIGDTSP